MTVEQGLFKRHFVGRDNFIWWLGQIVDETKWSGNIPGYRTPTTEEHKGFEYRYKVRIMGYHTAVPSELSDDDLPWASVMYPVTAGAGTGGLSQTPNLKQGMFVYGFFLDGEDAQQPIIMGVLGFNQYTQVLNNIPDAGFIPFEGYKFAQETVARYSLRTSKEQPLGKQSAKPPGSGDANDTKVQDPGGYTSLGDGASKQQKDEGQRQSSVPRTSVCEKAPMGQIQLDILNLVKDIEKAKRSLTDWETKVSTNIDNAQRWIEKKIAFVSDKVSQGIQWIITEIEKQTIKRVNDGLKDTYFLLFPNERPNLKTAVETANDLLACLFRKIIGNLFGLVSKLLTSIFDKVINVTECLINQFVATILGSVLDSILSGVTSVLGTVSGIVGTAANLVGDVLGFIADVFSFLTCDSKPECAEIDSWSPWDGADSTATLDVQGLFDQVTSFASNVTGQIENSVTAVQGAVSTVVNGFNESPLGGGCGVGPLLCGPPVVKFFGGEGSGTTGNVIIGLTGEILGVDIITQGGNYLEPPFVKFSDNCGTGSGAVGRAILEFDPDVENSDGGLQNKSNPKEGCIPVSGFKNGRVVAVVIEEPGKDYLYGYNGSEGGGGRKFSSYCETLVRRSSGCYDLPYLSGETINLNPGDWIKYPNTGSAVQVTEAQTVTAPVCGDYDSSNPPGPPPQFATPTPFNPTISPTDEEIYSIDLQLEEVVILEPGYDYTPGDPVVFIPSEDEYNPVNNGVVAVVEKVDPQGGILKVRIDNPGKSFVNYPTIYAESAKGFNAKFAPRFTITRITPEEVERRQQAPAGQILSVVDCVGKILPRQEFDIVPR